MGVHVDAETNTLINREIKLINRLLHDHGVQAAATLRRTMVAASSFIAYGLRLAPGETIKRIEAVTRELSNELTISRARHGHPQPCPVRLRDYPIALEVPHPSPTTLDWRAAILRSKSFHATIGRSYTLEGAQQEFIDLLQHYHILVAAMSGAGKSTLMRMALATLAYNTDPQDLHIMLIDLKADDLVPFRRLPHVAALASSVDAAAHVITQLHQLRDARIAGASRDRRMLLVIDELAELGERKETLAQLGRILSTGRSLAINVWAGTQYPTAATIGSVVAKSFTTRIVGRVDGAQAAQVATQRPKSGAHYLAHPGDFLRIDGPDMRRLKAFNLGQDATDGLISATCQRWGHRPNAVPLTVVSDSETTASTPAPSAADEIAVIAERIKPLWQQQATTAAMIRAVYGDHANTGGSNRNAILKAIDRLS
jgi:DNA segregation ATPase FtsK/SpoIIIE-like protein